MYEKVQDGEIFLKLVKLPLEPGWRG